MRPSGPLPAIACASITLSFARAAARGLMRKRTGAAGDGAAGATAGASATAIGAAPRAGFERAAGQDQRAGASAAGNKTALHQQ